MRRSDSYLNQSLTNVPSILSHFSSSNASVFDRIVKDWLDRKSGSAGMPRPISYAVFCLKKKTESHIRAPTQIHVLRNDRSVVSQHLVTRLGVSQLEGPVPTTLSFARLCPSL